MAGSTQRRVYRVAGNARRVIAPTLFVLFVITFLQSVNLALEYAQDWPWRAAPIAFMLLIYWASDARIGSRIVRWLSERAVKNDIAWAVISRVLAAARRIRAAFARLFATPPFQLLARLALPLAIVLTLAMTYRLAAFPALIARETGGSGPDLALLALDWLLFGLGYGLVGAAAPLVTTLLLLRRRRSSLGFATALHFLGLVGVSLVILRTFFAGFMSASGPDGAFAAQFHPLFAEPKAVGLVIHLLFAEFLANLLALFLLWRQQLLQHYDDQPANEAEGDG